MRWDGKMYDKYRIAHTDGTPLKGKKYFVLRLDSDDSVEAARVAAAMRAYKKEPRNCEVGTQEEQTTRFETFCSLHHPPKGKGCYSCPAIPTKSPCAFHRNVCRIKWSQLPYEKGDEDGSK